MIVLGLTVLMQFSCQNLESFFAKEIPLEIQCFEKQPQVDMVISSTDEVNVAIPQFNVLPIRGIGMRGGNSEQLAFSLFYCF